MMIWSTRRTVTAASVAILMASFLVCSRSITPRSAVTHSSTSMPTPTFPALCAAYISAITSVASIPAFCASVRGTTSSATPNLLIAYCSSPGCASPYAVIASASRSSHAPAPPTKRGSRVIDLTTLTPSSTARSTSSMMLGVEPRMMIVATREPSVSWSKMVQLVEPISLMCTRWQCPRSAAVGGSRRTRVLAPVVRHTRRSSNLEGTLRQRILYLSRKWSASSPTCWPHTITLTPTSAICLMIFSSDFSSELLYSLISSALLSSTVPFVSVVTESRGMPYTAIFALRTSVTVPSTERGRHMPRTTVVDCTLAPTILATRTLSMLKWAGLAGMAIEHASAILRAKSFSFPHCLEAMTGVMHAASCAGSLKTDCSGVKATSVSSVSRHLASAMLYPRMISLQCNPLLSSSSAMASNSPASTTTRFVPSPDSVSCILEARTSSLAAGCCTSSSLTMVAESFVMNNFSRWLITILFIPLGPSEVRTVLASCFAASMFFSVASSRPERCFAPSFSMPCMPNDPPVNDRAVAIAPA
mmetsp:Transcript_10681/g.26558  ORF Transcript_10681/g.26558 Transcript_10681/m.26558 type:complete len:531 (-) Transcript_10681:19-1611(-)